MDTNLEGRNDHGFETRSAPRSLPATDAGLPSMSLIPSAPFADGTDR
jgi:hypothetical protein